MAKIDQTYGEDFGRSNFPARPDSANRETKLSELYPQSLQDEVNDIYQHNKVLPRSEGVDFTGDKQGYNETSPENYSTFPHKY